MAPAPPEIPLIDPTANVIHLIDAVVSRQDDLRAADNRRIDELRKQQVFYEERLHKLGERAQKDIFLAESKRIDAVTLAESRRIDALLLANTNNVSLAAEKTSAQAATLAAQVATSAETLRNQVASTAATTTTLITELRNSVEKRLQVVEQNQYQGVGGALQRTEGRQVNQWVIYIVLIGFSSLASLGLGLFAAFRK